MSRTEAQKIANLAAVRRYQQTEKGKTTILAGDRHYRTTIVGHLRSIFKDIKKRCNNPKRVEYKNYGGRGIKCKFKSTDEFVFYVINVLQVDPRKLEIDRIDNDGDYEIGNIRFVTRSENCKNRRRK